MSENDAVEIEDLWIEHLLTAECQQLARQRSRAFPGFQDFVHAAAESVLRVEAFLQKLRVADDHAEKIIEIVGDPAREPAHGFHFLRLTKFFLELPRSLTSRFTMTNFSTCSLRIQNRARAGFDHVPASVLVAHTVLNGAAFAAGGRFLRRLFRHLTSSGMNLLEKRRALQLLIAVSENSRVGRAIVEPAPVRIHDGDHVHGVLADQAEQLLALAPADGGCGRSGTC